MVRNAQNVQAQSEQSQEDQRIGLLNSLLTTPHRKLDAVWPLHEQIVSADPLFYGHLASWYYEHGEIRDHKEAFTVGLCLSKFEGHRDAGLALLRELPPYQVARVVNFINGEKETKKVKPQVAKPRKGRVAAPPPPPAAGITGQTVTTSYGLFKTLPVSLKTEIARYLREREADNGWFDSSVLSARKHLKRLYGLCHIKPSDRAQKILFENAPPEDSAAAAVKELVKAATPADQAKIIIDRKIPYRIASTVISAMTPTVILALIESMSPQELINNLSSLKERGAFSNPDLKAKIDEKLVLAKKSKRVAGMKASVAKTAAGVDEATAKALDEIGDQQVKSKGRITRSTALCVDKSGSMEKSIELGKHIGSMISAVMNAPLYVYAFDTMPYPIKPQGTALADWEKAMAGIVAKNGTAIGAPIKALTAARQIVEQIVLVTDEGEANAPAFWPAIKEYRATTGANPSILIVKVKDHRGQWCDRLQEQAKALGEEVDAWKFEGDYYSLPQLIPFINKTSKLDLLIEIMSTPLPERKVS